MLQQQRGAVRGHQRKLPMYGLVCLFLAVVIVEQVSAQRKDVGPVHSMKNATEFMMRHVNKKPKIGGAVSREEQILFSQTGSVNPGGANQIADMLAEADTCDPRPTSVEIPLNASDPRVIYYPSCTRINRCGGCCGSDVTECSPIEVRRINVKVMKLRYPDDNSDVYEFEGLVDMPLEEHTGCECQCRVKEYHCDPVRHYYNADTCQCQCRNRQMATQCPTNKVWNENLCSCVCPRVPNCLHDEIFDFNTCSCQRAPVASSSPAVTVNPCSSSTTKCRAGWQLVAQSDGRCTCQIVNAGRKRRRHLGGNVDWRSLASQAKSRTKIHH